jgi:hypothetical protein
MIKSTKDDTLETILVKIQTPKDLNLKLRVYTMFRLTKYRSLNEINIYIQLKDPDLWEEIRKHFYPTLFEKIKKWFS